MKHAAIDTVVEIITQTVTQTVTTTPPIVTITKTFGTPWTTATPHLYTLTRYPNDPISRPTIIVEEAYPPQGPIYRTFRRCDDGKLAGFFFIGFGVALALVFILALVFKILRKRARRNGRIMLGHDEMATTPLMSGERCTCPPTDEEAHIASSTGTVKPAA